MPYIKSKQRDFLNPKIDNLFSKGLTKGEVNYCITRFVHLWVLNMTETNKRNYTILSEGHSVIQDAAAEYYSAVMLSYEKNKQKENGYISQLDAQNTKKHIN